MLIPVHVAPEKKDLASIIEKTQKTSKGKTFGELNINNDRK